MESSSSIELPGNNQTLIKKFKYLVRCRIAFIGDDVECRFVFVGESKKQLSGNDSELYQNFKIKNTEYVLPIKAVCHRDAMAQIKNENFKTNTIFMILLMSLLFVATILQ